MKAGATFTPCNCNERKMARSRRKDEIRRVLGGYQTWSLVFSSGCPQIERSTWKCGCTMDCVGNGRDNRGLANTVESVRQSRRDQLAEMMELRDFADRSNNARAARRELTRRNREKVMLAELRWSAPFESSQSRLKRRVEQIGADRSRIPFSAVGTRITARPSFRRLPNADDQHRHLDADGRRALLNPTGTAAGSL